MTGTVERSDEVFRAWMRDNLERAAAHFGLTITGEATFGWRLRSLGVAAHGAEGPCWLRVCTERTEHLHHHAEFWTGIPDTNTITGVPKPRALASTTWEVADQQRRVRADVVTVLPGRPCSPTDVLRAPVDLPEVWWQTLRAALDRLRTVSTSRYATRGTDTDRVRDTLGVDLRIRRWETIHSDMHWNNLLAPQLGILDWEFWGRGPVGTDAASLYCYSLTAPETARHVWTVFADVLDTDDGARALLWVAARLLHRVTHFGEYPDLVTPLRELADRVTPNVAEPM